MSPSFSNVPSKATIRTTPFKISIPDDEISDLKSLIRLSRLGPDTFENQREGDVTEYGVTKKWLSNASEVWEKQFDWKECEKHMNSFPQFTTEIEGLTVHFVALFSEKEDAIPIVLLHGWPGSFLEFLPMLGLFQDEYSPSTLPYHLIVPSLPGYAFSSGPPLDKDFGIQDITRVMDKLMVGLGFGRGYVAQGGDIGSRVSRMLGVDYESCKAVHLNFNLMRKPDHVSDSSYSELEKSRLARYTDFMTRGNAYALMQGTRPSTIGHVLSSSPLALLAWIGEKFLTWTDRGSTPPLKVILESVSLYWFTSTFPRAIYPYRQNYPPPPDHPPFHMDPRWHIAEKPFGFSYFPNEVAPMPKSWVETTGNLVFWREHDKGGHFAALERPADLKKDVEDFVSSVKCGTK